MKKKFKLTDLDCANCAAKMEEAIKKIEGVKDANVSFMMQKMTIEADDDLFDQIMEQVDVYKRQVKKTLKAGWLIYNFAAALEILPS